MWSYSSWSLALIQITVERRTRRPRNGQMKHREHTSRAKMDRGKRELPRFRKVFGTRSIHPKTLKIVTCHFREFGIHQRREFWFYSLLRRRRRSELQRGANNGTHLSSFIIDEGAVREAHPGLLSRGLSARCGEFGFLGWAWVCIC